MPHHPALPALPGDLARRRPVEVTWARVSDHRRHLPALWSLLDASERARAERLRAVADRERFILAAAILRLRVAEVTGTSAAGRLVDRTCPRCGAAHGRPRPLAAGWHASVTHSGDLVAVAVADGTEVGVDLEVPCLPDAGTLSLVLDERERAWVESAGGGAAHRFTRLWTGKEAVAKALGTGLPSVPYLRLRPGATRLVVFPEGPDGPAVHLRHLPLPGAPEGVAEVAVATVGGETPVSLRVWDRSGRT